MTLPGSYLIIFEHITNTISIGKWQLRTTQSLKHMTAYVGYWLRTLESNEFFLNTSSAVECQ